MSWQVVMQTSGGELTLKNSDKVEVATIVLAKYTRTMQVDIDYEELNELVAGLQQVQKMMKSQRKVKRDARVAEEPEAG